MSEHTPTPWAFDCDPNEITGKPFANIWSTANEGRMDLAYLSLREHEVAANAAFIVKACNAHDSLVTALSTIADIGEGSQTINSLPHIAKIARAALASIKAPS